jgi:hypothetical protein
MEARSGEAAAEYPGSAVGGGGGGAIWQDGRVGRISWGERASGCDLSSSVCD